MIPRDVVTRWNSTYKALCFVLAYRQPVDAITAKEKYKLRKYKLDNEDWQIIRDLVCLLKVTISLGSLFLSLKGSELTYLLQKYKQATLFFSQDSASIAAVIPAIDKLNDHLNDVTKQDYHAAIKAAMKLAQNKLDRHWRRTDQPIIYRVAMGMCSVSYWMRVALRHELLSPVLHPGLKLEYFRKQRWKQKWIDETLTVTRAEYVVNYKGKTSPPEETSEATPDPEPIAQRESGAFGGFGDYSLGPDTAAQRTDNELDDYLQQPVEKIKDALKWWSDPTNQKRFPNLSRMALDYLSGPGKKFSTISRFTFFKKKNDCSLASSVSVKRVFPQAQQLLHSTRHRLSPTFIRASMCLGSWSRQNLVDDQDFMQIAVKKRKYDEFK